MFDKTIDLLAIGDITTDAFIRIEGGNEHCRLDNTNQELCMKLGDKVPFEYVKVIRAVGNSANVATAMSRFGIRSALMTQIGDDQNGKDCLKNLLGEKVDNRFIKIHEVIFIDNYPSDHLAKLTN